MLGVRLGDVGCVPGVEGGVGRCAVHELLVLRAAALLRLLASEGVLGVGGVALGQVVPGLELAGVQRLPATRSRGVRALPGVRTGPTGPDPVLALMEVHLLLNLLSLLL